MNTIHQAADDAPHSRLAEVLTALGAVLLVGGVASIGGGRAPARAAAPPPPAEASAGSIEAVRDLAVADPIAAGRARDAMADGRLDETEARSILATAGAGRPIDAATARTDLARTLASMEKRP